jgi:hypothetical protein
MPAHALELLLWPRLQECQSYRARLGQKLIFVRHLAIDYAKVPHPLVRAGKRLADVVKNPGLLVATLLASASPIYNCHVSNHSKLDQGIRTLPTNLSVDKDLVRLASQARAIGASPCKICGHDCEPFDVVDFNKFCDGDPHRLGLSHIDVEYVRCRSCECLFTSFFDSWETSDFRQFIYNDEYIKVDPDYTFERPFATARILRHRLDQAKSARTLDFGSGSGILCKIMNEFGFNYDSYDPFSSPAPPEDLVDIVTAFEVVEHSPTPMQTFKQILAFMPERKIILVGQSLQPDDIMEIRGSWWYLAPRNGHCTTYTEKTFTTVAEQLGLHFKAGTGLYGFYSDENDELTQIVMSAVL